MLRSFKFFFFPVIILSLSISILAQNQTASDYFAEGLEFANKKQFEQALEAFRQSAKLDPKQAATHANIGNILMILKRSAEGVEAYRESVRLAPDSAEMRAGLCKALGFVNQIPEAIAECRKAIELDENSVQANISMIAVLQMQDRQSAQLLSLIENTLQRFSNNLNLLDTAAAYFYDTRNAQRALEIYEKLARAVPFSAFYQVRLAEIYLQLERDTEAIAAAKKAIEIEPDNVLAHYFLGKVYFELGQNEEAAKAFQKGAEFGLDFPEIFYFLGVSQSLSGKTEEGIAALRKAVKLNPNSFEYHRELGSQLNLATKYEEAIAPYKRALELKPKNFGAKVGLGLALFESAKYEEAVPVLMEANQMKPGDPIVNMFLNVTRSRQQGVARIEQMKHFARENPKNLDIKLNLLEILGFARRIDEIEPYVDDILKAKPKDEKFYQRIAVVYSTAGKFEKSAEMYKRGIENNPNYAGSYLGLAGISKKSGKIEEAFRFYDKALELQPDASGFMKLYADLLRENGKNQAALEMFKRALEFLPTDSFALFNAGFLSAKLGDMNAAQIYLERLKSVDTESAKRLERCLRLRF